MTKDCDNEDEIGKESFKLLNSQVTIYKRKNPAIIKIPHISISDNESEYYYSLLVLYVPFRIEANILLGYDSVENAYIHNFSDACNNQYVKDIDKIEQLTRAIELIQLLRETSQKLNEVTENILDINDFERADDEFVEDYEEIDNDEIILPVYNHSQLNKSIKDRVHLLNEKQKNIFEKVKYKLTHKDQKQFIQIIHGSGGTGKSFVSELIKDLVNLYEHSVSNPNNNSFVIVPAPTGVAAKNIKGFKY
jgi:hypothetical protein